MTTPRVGDFLPGDMEEEWFSRLPIDLVTKNSGIYVTDDRKALLRLQTQLYSSATSAALVPHNSAYARIEEELAQEKIRAARLELELRSAAQRLAEQVTFKALLFCAV